MINVYSKSESQLGRLLSNFAHTPFTFDGQVYQSVEAWWYYYLTGEKYPHLKLLYGYNAKKAGKVYPRVNFITPELLKKVYYAKLECNPNIRKMLIDSAGEFTHYYVFDGKVVQAKEWEWTAQLWKFIRSELQASDWSGAKVINGEWKGSVT